MARMRSYNLHTLSLILIFITLSFFFFNDTATTEIYTLSLHDALPISSAPDRGTGRRLRLRLLFAGMVGSNMLARAADGEDRKSTRLNSSHTVISYAVFCLKKKKKKLYEIIRKT